MLPSRVCVSWTQKSCLWSRKYEVNNPFGLSRRERCVGLFHFILDKVDSEGRFVLGTSLGLYALWTIGTSIVYLCVLTKYHLGRVTVSGGDCPLRGSHVSCNRSWGIWNHVRIISSPLPRPGNSSAAPVITLLHYCYCIIVTSSLHVRVTLGHGCIPLIKDTATVMEMWTSRFWKVLTVGE